MQSLNEILQDRGGTYGDFSRQATISQELKNSFYKNTRNYGKMTPAMKEAIEMIFHKIARIANGDPTYVDSWVDIAGYATLVVESLQKVPNEVD